MPNIDCMFSPPLCQFVRLIIIQIDLFNLKLVHDYSLAKTILNTVINCRRGIKNVIPSLITNHLWNESRCINFCCCNYALKVVGTGVFVNPMKTTHCHKLSMFAKINDLVFSDYKYNVFVISFISASKQPIDIKSDMNKNVSYII